MSAALYTLAWCAVAAAAVAYLGYQEWLIDRREQ